MDDEAAGGEVSTRRRHPAFSGVCKPSWLADQITDKNDSQGKIQEKNQTVSAVLPNQDGKAFEPVLAHAAGDSPFKNDKAALR